MPNRPPLRIEMRDAIDQFHAAAGQTQPVRQTPTGEERSETSCEIAAAQRIELFGAIRFDADGRQLGGIVWLDAGAWARIERGLHDALAGRPVPLR